ncbi:MAG: GGDEF domain-containing protein [Nitrospira sp.]|nr:GGDEF domain-containing protein [bacterium]MBL7048450.1 GGDEF domain-containing protein [Nitrospira sp.]
MCARKVNPDDENIRKLKEDLLPHLKHGIQGKGHNYRNPNLLKCWKILECGETGCIVYKPGSKAVRCWQVTGTKCGGRTQGGLQQKMAECSKCRVFQESCPTMADEIGEYFNNSLFLLKHQNEELNDSIKTIKDLEEKIATATDHLDQKNRDIVEITITDKLTGLYNKHHFSSILNEELARCHRYSHPIALLIINIDDFKSTITQYGQGAGDRILSSLGKLIQKQIRKFDRAFRYGEEEFCVILPETDITLAYLVAERVRSSFASKTYKISSRNSEDSIKISSTVSIGVTSFFSYAPETISVDEIIKKTELALNNAKQRGGNVSVRAE